VRGVERGVVLTKLVTGFSWSETEPEDGFVVLRRAD
jgi:hypothetical protein